MAGIWIDELASSCCKAPLVECLPCQKAICSKCRNCPTCGSPDDNFENDALDWKPAPAGRVARRRDRRAA